MMRRDKTALRIDSLPATSSRYTRKHRYARSCLVGLIAVSLMSEQLASAQVYPMEPAAGQGTVARGRSAGRAAAADPTHLTSKPAAAPGAADSTGLPAAGAQRRGQWMTLYVGQATVLSEPDVRRIAIGNGKVLNATSIDGRQVLLIPEAPGQTTLHVWTRGGDEKTFVVNVVSTDLQRLVGEVQAMLGDDSGVQARIVGDTVVLEGGKPSAEASMRIRQVLQRFPQVVSVVSKVGVEQMIAMDVRIVEVRKSALENLGINWQKSIQGPSFGVVGDMATNRYFRATPDAAGGSPALNLPDLAAPIVRPGKISPFAAFFGLQTAIGSMLNLMVQNGDAVVLAEPRLSCRSGGSAKFLAGGEIPIPSQGLGHSTVNFKPYGVKFEISPVASKSGVIAARVFTELSAIDPSISVANLPAFLTRRTETDVNLHEGETLVMSGLVSEEASRNVDKVAGAGDLPILGPLFRSKDFRDKRSELVIFVTPRFISPDAALNRQMLERAESELKRARDAVHNGPPEPKLVEPASGLREP